MTDKNLKIDISSTAIEKGIDVAKTFLEKLIMPSIDEVGLLIKENVAYWRFKNQVKMLNKAQKYCLENNITPKSISLKLLCPLLDNASLEEDEFLQDKWVVLLSNMVDSSQNIQNHVFPFLLGQISKPEFIVLEQAVILKEQKLINLHAELEDFKNFRAKEEVILKEKFQTIGDIKGKWELEKGMKDLEEKELKIELDMSKQDYLSYSKLEEFELSNLIRLGLVKSIPQHNVFTRGAEIRNDPESAYLILEDLEIEIENEGDKYLMTELGDLFIKACKEK
jgi:hypothetical protein